jgi:uncharacterized protein YegP (UPF0339 family)
MAIAWSGQRTAPRRTILIWIAVACACSRLGAAARRKGPSQAAGGDLYLRDLRQNLSVHPWTLLASWTTAPETEGTRWPQSSRFRRITPASSGSTSKAPNGEIIAASQGYESKASAEKGIEAIKARAPGAKVEDHS